ncbi:MAG: tetratricopeptide repeat protein [Nitrospirota bacterium]
MNYNRYHLIAIFFIILSSSIIYFNTIHSPFQYDGRPIIAENKHIHLDELSLSGIIDAGFKSPSYRRPVANISFAINYYFGRLNTFGYHLVNIIIHIITGIAIYLFLFATLKISSESHVLSLELQGIKDKSFWIALIASLLWVTSPVQTQAVTYIVQRMTSMATMFYMLSLLCYVKGRVVSEVRSKGRLDGLLASGFWLLTSLFFALLAFGTKEISATLPVVIILYEIYFFTGFDPEKIKKRLIYFVLIMMAIIILNFLYINSMGSFFEGLKKIISKRVIEQQEFTSFERLLTQSRVVIYYISLLILPLPSRLRLSYDFIVSHSIFDPITTFISIITIFTLIIYAVSIARKRPIISFFIIWFFLNLAIESGIIRLYIAFEHRLYLPSVGFFVIVAIGIVKLMNMVKSSPRYSAHNYLLFAACSSFLIVLFLTQSIWTIQRNYVWRDEISLWKDTIKKSPSLYMPHNNLGSVYEKEGVLDLAVREYQEALKINSDDDRIHNNLGIAYGKQGKADMAIREYKEALRINPDNSNTHNNLGVVYREQGRTGMAVREYLEALKIDPDNRNTHNNLAVVYEKQGVLDLAVREYQEALKINPDDGGTHNNLGVVYEKQGRADMAVREYLEALKIDPDHYQGHYNLGSIYQRKGESEKALKEYIEAVRINPDYYQAHNALGNIYRDKGMLDLAIKEYQAGLRIRPDDFIIHNNLGIAYMLTMEIDHAIKEFQEVIKVKPGHLGAHVNLANIYRDMGKPDLAISEYRKVLKIYPDFKAARDNIADP